MVADNALKVRFLSALVFGAAVLGILYAGGIPYALMMLAGVGVAIYEWGKMIFAKKRHRIILMLLGVCYIGFSMGTMIWLRISFQQGLYNMLTLLLIVWASDVSAYFSGKTIGGPKLAPIISPKKTWAGFIGSSIGAGLVAAALTQAHVETVGHMTASGYFVMGFVLAMVGQMGDLFISIFKRRSGIKDTGAIMPGHGGLLDRIDALLLVALVFGAIVRHFQ